MDDSTKIKDKPDINSILMKQYIIAPSCVEYDIGIIEYDGSITIRNKEGITKHLYCCHNLAMKCNLFCAVCHGDFKGTAYYHDYPYRLYICHNTIFLFKEFEIKCEVSRIDKGNKEIYYFS